MKNSSSFRDSSGFVFSREGQLYRQVNGTYRESYDCARRTGLIDELSRRRLVVKENEVDISPEDEQTCYRIVKPEVVPFISYPYEWCFGQLRDAALLTLQIQKIALQHNMGLRDCSAFNVQFTNGAPIFIDTLSFEEYKEGIPWVAYRQFCQHFLAPLALMAYRDARLLHLFKSFIDGVPLDLAVSLLPIRSCLNIGLCLHLFLHAKSQDRLHGQSTSTRFLRRMSKGALCELVGSLENAVARMRRSKSISRWSGYYDDLHYSRNAFSHKVNVVEEYLRVVSPKTVWDFGSNTGCFSKLACGLGAHVVAFDNDSASVEASYERNVRGKDIRLLPLVLDLTNPSGGVGWANKERDSLLERGPADLVIALALIHHLAIGSNIPLDFIASFLAKAGRHLIVEFVPKEDDQVKAMFVVRSDVFSDYTQDGFEKAFSPLFDILSRQPLCESPRSLYLLRRK